MRKSGWFLFLILMISAIVAGWYLYQICQRETHEVRDFHVPGRLAPIYVKVSEKYGIPWYVLAAIDEVENGYRQVNQNTIERNAGKVKKALNGLSAEEEEIRQALNQIYPPEKVKQMMVLIEAYEWEAAPLSKSYAFPFRKQDRGKVDYVDSWGAPRTYGGKRKHEGTDLMAPKVTPIVAVTDGKVVRKGWDRLGGWRLFIQDGEHGHIYYYYAHLSRYENGIEEGVTVKKGQVIGYVGDSGYGPEGTTGQFAPHLHFGIYVSEGWIPVSRKAINPYPFLRVWETWG